MTKPTINHSHPHIFVCQNCKTGADMLQKVQDTLGAEACVLPTRCTGGCGPREKGKGFASIAFVADGKDSCLFHKFTAADDDMMLLQDFFNQYNTSAEGRIRIINMKHPRADEDYFLARLPHLPTTSS